MNRVIEATPVKTFAIVVLGIGVLVLAGYGAQLVLTSEPAFGPAVAAPEAEEAAPAVDTSGLERDLKEVVRGQGAAETNAATAPYMDTSGLERDLKEIWRSQFLTQTGEETAPSVDTSGLERELKDIVREGMAGESQAQ